MLVNKTKKSVVVKYNSIEITVLAGADLDVRDFGVDPKNISYVEDHLLRKNLVDGNAAFEKVDRPALSGNSETVTQLENKLIDAQKEAAVASEKLKEAVSANEELQKRALSLNDENQAQGAQIKKLMDEVKDLKAKIKKLE